MGGWVGVGVCLSLCLCLSRVGACSWSSRFLCVDSVPSHAGTSSSRLPREGSGMTFVSPWTSAKIFYLHAYLTLVEVENSRNPWNFEEAVRALVFSVADKKSGAFWFCSSVRGLLLLSGSFKGVFFIPKSMGFKGVFFIPPLTVEARLFFCFLFPFLEISLLDTIIDSSVLRVFFPPSLVSLFTFVFYLLGDFLNFLLIYIYIYIFF